MNCAPTRAWPLVVALGFAGLPAVATPQAALERLPREVFDVAPPSARVRGTPGDMAVLSQPCGSSPSAETRRRIVDVAVQEWAFFGYRVLDQTVPRDEEARLADDADARPARDTGPRGRRRPRLAPAEAARVASSIAGYWAVTSEGAWIVERQNEEWKGPDGIAARWNAPWSAAFISWVMCEAGLGGPDRFQRAIAHHTYIDQAIRARDGGAPQAAFAAYDVGESVIAPGDLLCSSRRPAYRTIAERRRQMGVGARSHCDVVVQVDDAGERTLAIGGNVRGTVSLKILRARPGVPAATPADADERPMFAHLKLRAAPIEPNALETSQTLGAAGCRQGSQLSAALAAARVALASTTDRC